MAPYFARIPGPAIAGLDDVFVGAAPLKKPGGGLQKPVVLVTTKPGAVSKPPPGKPVAKLPPGAKVPVRTAKGGTNKDGFGNAKAAAVSALRAGDKAIAAAKKGAAAVKKHTVAVKLGHHAPVILLGIAGLRENGQVVLGVVAKKPLSPVQQKAVNRHTSLVAKTAAATRRLGALAQKAQAAGQAALAASKQTTGAIASSLKPKWKKGGARVGEALDLYYDFVGAGPDPDRPGYLTDGTLDPIILIGGAEFDLAAPPADPNAPPYDPNAPADPNAAPYDPGLDLSQDTGTGAVTAPDGTVLYDPATDPQVVPVPQRGGALSAEDAQISWQHPPDDGILYDGSRGLPKNSVGSWNAFYGGDKKSDDGSWGIPAFLRGDVGDGGIVWMFNDGADGLFRRAPGEYQSAAATGAPDAKAVSANSLNRGWGPIIGNPAGPLAGLQFAIADGTWFWQATTAPTWATAETDAKIASANQKIIAANRAAALVQAAQMQKDALEAAQAKAKQDAANALAMSAADTQSQIADKQVTAQKSQLEVQTQKAELDAQKMEAQMAASQQQAELQAAQQQAQIDAQAQHALVTQADVWNKWAAENPEEAVVLMQQGMAPGGDNYGGGGGEEYYDEDAEAYGGQNDGPRMYGGEDGGGEDDTEGD